MKNQLELIFNKDVAYADSRVIAQYYGKRHNHVVRDIENMFDKLGFDNPDLSRENSIGSDLSREIYKSSYVSDRGKTDSCCSYFKKSYW